MRSRAVALLAALAFLGVQADSEEDVAIAEELAFGATGEHVPEARARAHSSQTRTAAHH